MATRAVLAFLIALPCLSCGDDEPPSEDEIREDFARVVARSNSCSDVTECVLVYPGCPLGCYVAVNQSSAADVEERAEELIADYQSAGRSCDYGCREAPPLECTDSRCTLAE